MENNKTFTLMNGGNTLFLLPLEVLAKSSLIQKKNKKDFLKGKAKKDVAPPVLLDEELYNVIS
jgi:hypothetical protein